MFKRKTWECDFEDCTENAEYYRRVKGKIVKICLHHEVYMRKEGMGISVQFSQLSRKDINYLELKDDEIEFECPSCHIKKIVDSMTLEDSNGRISCPTCRMLMEQV